MCQDRVWGKARLKSSLASHHEMLLAVYSEHTSIYSISHIDPHSEPDFAGRSRQTAGLAGDSSQPGVRAGTRHSHSWPGVPSEG